MNQLLRRSLCGCRYGKISSLLIRDTNNTLTLAQQSVFIVKQLWQPLHMRAITSHSHRYNSSTPILALITHPHHQQRRQISKRTDKNPPKKAVFGLTTKSLKWVYITAGVLIGLILYVEVTYSDKEEMIERRKATSGKSAAEYTFTQTCMRSSVIMAIVGSFTAWVATFLITSDLWKAMGAFAWAPCIVFGCYYCICYMSQYKDRKEAQELQKVIKDTKERNMTAMNNAVSDGVTDFNDERK